MFNYVLYTIPHVYLPIIIQQKPKYVHCFYRFKMAAKIPLLISLRFGYGQNLKYLFPKSVLL